MEPLVLPDQPAGDTSQATACGSRFTRVGGLGIEPGFWQNESQPEAWQIIRLGRSGLRHRMRIHPISLALRYLNGHKTMRAAPYRGGALFESSEAAIAVLKKLTGQDFGADAKKWGDWLRKHRGVYYKSGPGTDAASDPPKRERLKRSGCQ